MFSRERIKAGPNWGLGRRLASINNFCHLCVYILDRNILMHVISGPVPFHSRQVLTPFGGPAWITIARIKTSRATNRLAIRSSAEPHSAVTAMMDLARKGVDHPSAPTSVVSTWPPANSLVGGGPSPGAFRPSPGAFRPSPGRSGRRQGVQAVARGVQAIAMGVQSEYQGKSE
jgi:hypothetical protein